MTQAEISFLKQKIRNSLRKESYPPQPKGGQSVGVGPNGVKLIHDDLAFEIAISHHRSQIKNLELALTLFDLYLDEYLKV